MLSAVQGAGQTQQRERGCWPPTPSWSGPASSGRIEIRGAIRGLGAGENKHISKEREIRGLLGR